MDKCRILKGITLLGLFVVVVCCGRSYVSLADCVFCLHADVEWDVDGMQQAMEDRVYGQAKPTRQLVEGLSWALQDEHNGQTEAGLKTIFLLGGPGVGKTQALEIFTSHIHCRYRNVFGMLPCEVHACSLPPSPTFIRQKYSESTKLIRYHGSLFNTLELDLLNFTDKHAEGFATLEAEISRTGSNRRLFLVTGPLIKPHQLERLRTPAQYAQLLDQHAIRIGKIMKTIAPNVELEIIKFNSLKPSHVVLCLLEHGGTDLDLIADSQRKWEDAKSDYVPEGCTAPDLDEP